MTETSYGARAQLVDGDGGDDDRPDDDLLNVVRPSHLLAAVAQERHDQRADHRAEDAAFAAVQTPAADDDGGDDVELGALRRPSDRPAAGATSASRRRAQRTDPANA